MAAPSKIQDLAEVKRWYEAGYTYRWMVEQYAEKYNVAITETAFSNLRARHGWDRRAARDRDLVPWNVKHEHRWASLLSGLRAEGRKRSGLPLTALAAARLGNLHRRLLEEGAVIHYDPDTEQGFFLVPRREGVDRDMIREPDRSTALRGNADEGE